MSVLQKVTRLDPLRGLNARIDPFMNKMGAYGKNAPTPWDPFAVKAGAFGYDTSAVDQQNARTSAQLAALTASSNQEKWANLYTTPAQRKAMADADSTNKLSTSALLGS